jgi:hemerythrin-like domain-containing protein
MGQPSAYRELRVIGRLIPPEPSTSRQPRRVSAAVITASERKGESMDAITFLREDHLKVLAMLDELERSQLATPADLPADHDARKRLVTELVMAESAHEAVEEQYFWPSVQDGLEEGRDLAAPALQQEQSAKRVLDELDKLDPDDPKFEELLSQIITDGREHIAYEEREVWPIVQQRMSSSELEEVGEKMAKAKKMAPTRPHPSTPPKAGVLKTAGAAAAVTDKIRDAATGRGKD